MLKIHKYTLVHSTVEIPLELRTDQNIEAIREISETEYSPLKDGIVVERGALDDNFGNLNVTPDFRAFLEECLEHREVDEFLFHN